MFKYTHEIVVTAVPHNVELCCKLLCMSCPGFDLTLLADCERAIVLGTGLNNTVRMIRESQHEQYDKDEAVFHCMMEHLGQSAIGSTEAWAGWRRGLAENQPGVAFPNKKVYGVACPSGVPSVWLILQC